MSGASNLLPPRKRDWKKGVPQVGAFLRTKDGASIQFVRDRADDTDVALVVALVTGKVPPDLLSKLLEWHKEFTLKGGKL